MTNIVIFGGTGFAGGHIASEAVERGHRVRIIARTAAVDGVPGSERWPGDIHDAMFRREALADADVVVVALRAAAIDDGGRRLIDALPGLVADVQAAHVRLGVVGGAGSLQVADGGPTLLDAPGFPEPAIAEGTAQAGTLEYLRQHAGAARWFYVSPAALFGAHAPGEKTGEYRTGGNVLLRDTEGQSRISGADYAAAFVDEIEKPTHENVRFSVAY